MKAVELIWLVNSPGPKMVESSSSNLNFYCGIAVLTGGDNRRGNGVEVIAVTELAGDEAGISFLLFCRVRKSRGILRA